MNNLGKKLSAIFMDAVLMPYNIGKNGANHIVENEVAGAIGGALMFMSVINPVLMFPAALCLGGGISAAKPNLFSEYFPRTAKAFAKDVTAPVSAPTPKV